MLTACISAIALGYIQYCRVGYTQTLAILSQATSLNDSKFNSSSGQQIKFAHCILGKENKDKTDVNDEHLIDMNGIKLLTNEMITQDIYQKVSTSDKSVTTFKVYKDVERKYEQAHGIMLPYRYSSKTGYLDVTNLLSSIHTQFKTTIGAPTPVEVPFRMPSVKINNVFRTGDSTGSKKGELESFINVTTKMRTGRQIVNYGVPYSCGTNLLIIGPYMHDRFVPNDKLIMKMDTDFDSFRCETEQNEKFYQQVTYGILVGASICGAIELYCYYNEAEKNKQWRVDY